MRTLVFLSGLMLGGSAIATESADNQTTTSPLHVISTERQGDIAIGVPIVKRSSAQSAENSDTHKAKQAAASLQRKGEITRNNNPDFWIYDAFITYDEDEDFDGYYSRFTLEFDADTAFVSADVYARLFLSRGDVFEEYHTTSIFTINGDSSLDALVVDSQLLSGFPSGDYEMLIELYDTFDESLVAVFDGFNDADLTLLTLESKNFEEAETTIVIVEESGGSFGYLMVLLLPLVLRRLGRQY